MKEKNVFGKIIQIAGYIVLLGIVVFLIAQSRSDETWECVQTACTRLMTQKEMVDRFCFMDEQQRFQCSLNIDGQPALVPLDALNLSSIQLCSEFRCLKEMKVRAANYSVNISVR